MQYVIGAAIVSWPPVIAGFVINHHRMRAHVDRVTRDQTEQIAELTEAQTAELEQHRESRHPRPPGGYHGHEDSRS